MAGPFTIRATIVTTTAPIILFIDDEPTLGTTVIRFVERRFSGYQIAWARDGAAGVAMAQAHVDQLRLVVLDIDMPRMDGNLAAVQIRTLAPHVPVMPFSAYAQSFPALIELGCAAPAVKSPEIVSRLPLLMRQAMATTIAPMPELAWVAAMRQSGAMTLARDVDDNPAIEGALRWLNKYCSRYTTPAREIINARKLLQEGVS